MRPFNLERALAGDKVVCRDPKLEVLSVQRCTVTGIGECLYVEMLHRELGSGSSLHYIGGRSIYDGDVLLDLFMADCKEDVS